MDRAADGWPFLSFRQPTQLEWPFKPEQVRRRLTFSGRAWEVAAILHRPMVVTDPPWEVVGAQASSFLLVTLLGVLLMAAAGSKRRIEEDVSRRTAQLSEAEERFRHLADNVDEVFWITSADGQTIEYLSRGFERIWGCDPEVFGASSRAWRRSIHEEDRNRCRKLFERAMAGKGFDGEYRIVRPDGEVRWIRDRGFPVRDESGGILRIAGVADDTTEQKRIEEGLRAAKQAAEEASEVLEAFFRVSLDMLSVAGTDGYFKRINPAFSATLGYADAELLDRPFVEFVHPDDVEMTTAAVAQLAEGRPLIRFQNRYRHRDGRYLWLEWSAMPETRKKLIYAAARNVTERRKMEDELRRSNAELEQFAYVASHDLQEPLRMVTSFAQLLQRRYSGKLDENADEYIHHIVDGTERMRRLILGLLELSRVDRKGRPLSVVDSAVALEMALQNLKVAIEESGTTIRIGELPKVMADHEQLARVFQNLVSNAIKYCRGRHPVIEIEGALVDGRWRFSVSDNGPGIEPVQRERVFQIFQRLHSKDEVPGTGIGLAICRRIVNRHGGEIWIEPSESGGARFVFTLTGVEPPDVAANPSGG